MGWVQALKPRRVECLKDRVSAGASLMRSMCGDFLFSLFHFLVGVDAVGGDFDFGNAAEGEQKLYEVLGWLFRSLFHNVANSVGDRGLEHHTFGLQAGKVHAHKLARLQHDSYTKILPPQVVKCKPFPTIPRQNDNSKSFRGRGRFRKQMLRRGLRRDGLGAGWGEMEPDEPFA